MAMQMRTPFRKNLGNTRTWHGAAFIMEALALLFFMVVCMAIIMQMLSFAYHRSDEADRLSAAVLIATNEAEAFAANPQSVGSTAYYGLVDGVLTPLPQEEPGCYVIKNTVSADTKDSGTMYTLDSIVSLDGEPLYELPTSRYQSNGGVR